MNDNRRIEHRNLCASLARLVWRNAEGVERACEANVLDVSTRGVGVQVDEQLSLGCGIVVDWHGHSFTGVVRHVHESELGPVVGVEFDEHCRWSEFVVTPEYLILPKAD